MKHFVIDLHYIVPMDRIEAAVQEHRAFLQTGYDQGLLLCSGPKTPRTGGVIIARAPSLAHLQAFCSEDPFLKQGLAEYRYTEFTPVKRQHFLEGWANGA